MSAFQTLGFFYVVLATGLFTAALLIAATWSITLGLKITMRRYKLGESFEQPLTQEEPQRVGQRS